jgi:MoxR-like ATPase
MRPGTAAFTELTDALIARIQEVVEGKPEAVRTAVLVQLAGGHLLVEDVPGVGKTLLARTLAGALGGSVNRIQFTPDLLPADITGVSVFHQERHDFQFRPGPVFAHLVIADEINRASAKTQAALLEAMEEHRVSVDGTTHRLPDPFMVVATQNPSDSQGTYPLPEAQRDRFMARISMGYPDTDAEVLMLAHHTHDPESPATPLRDEVEPVMDVEAARELIAATARVAVGEPVRRYLVALGQATREHADVRVGASPRALVQWMSAARAEAALSGRDYVVPDDVRAVAHVVLPHRLLLDGPVRHDTTSPQARRIVDEVLSQVQAPFASRAEARAAR